ncbi:MAG: hypothetical protein EA349_05340 [Halomonadaceae bacterium]|nr:MAG: hypothetical protein EA349_05340 [Halomonadaceae bacterium]
MNEPSKQQDYDPATVRSGQLKAAALFAIAIIPVLVATLMFFTGWGVPGATSNKGDLVPGGTLATDLGLVNEEGESLQGLFLDNNDNATWWLVVVADECNQACEDMVFLTRQVHISLNRQSNRLSRAFHATDMDEVDLSEHPRLSLWQRENGPVTLPEGVSPADGPYAYIIDPIGNLVMRYDSSHAGRDMLDDLKHLFKVSPLG